MQPTWCRCRKAQRAYDGCMLEKLEMRRPELGHFARPHIHETDRPQPTSLWQRDHHAEAAQVVQRLPDDYPVRDDPKKYRDSINSVLNVMR